jgi:hypothetical protein
MKKLIIPIIVVVFTATTAFAYSTPWHKLSSGVKEIVTAPLSLFRVLSEQSKNEHDRTLGIAGGIMEGIAQTAIKPISGAFKILTFPFVNHEFDEE